MTTAGLQPFFYISLTLRHTVTGTTQTYYFGNRAVSVDIGTYFPLLKQPSDIGTTMGPYVSQTKAGDIQLDNSRGALGGQRRLSDIFSVYSPLDQEVVMYANNATIDSTDLISGATRVFRATVSNWSYSEDNETLSLSIDGATYPKYLAGWAIDNSVLTSAPAASIGKWLPVVIGSNVDCAGVCAYPSGNDAIHLMCVGFNGAAAANKLPITGVASVSVKRTNGTYQALAQGSTTTAVLGNVYASNAIGRTLGPTSEYIYEMWNLANNAYIITAATFHVYSTVVGAKTTKFTLTLYSADDGTGNNRKKIATFTQTLTTAATGDFDINFFATEGIILEGGAKYYVGIQADNTNFTAVYNTTSSVATNYERLISSGENAVWTVSASTNREIFGFFAAAYSLGTVAAAGTPWIPYGVQLSNIVSINGVGVTPTTVLTNVSITARINGIQDTSTGALGLGASTQITSAKWAIAALCQSWDGTNWGNSILDTSVFSGMHVGIRQTTTDPYNRSISIASTANQTAAALIEAICRNNACRLTAINSTTTGKYLALQGWGSSQTSSGTFHDENCKILRVYQKGSESVVNSVIVAYGRSVTNSNAQLAAQEGRVQGYDYILKRENGSSLRFTSLASESYAAFGTRPNAQQGFEGIGDSTTAEILAESMIATFGLPHMLAEIEVPLFDFADMETLKVYEAIHTALPSFYGTEVDATLPTYGGDEVDILDSHYWKRAKRYRCQIEDKRIVPNTDGFPVIRATVRLLTNFGKDSM